MIKKLVYTGGTHNLNVCHNKAMAHMNLMNLYQDKFQDIREIREQYMAMRKVCNKLGLRIGRCSDDAKAVVKEKGINDPSNAQLEKAIDKIEEEHHAIVFLYKTDKSHCGTLLEQMENDMLQQNKT